MRKSVKINNVDVPIRQLTYGEYDECLILSETIVEYADIKGNIQHVKQTKDSIYLSEALKRMLCIKKPAEQDYQLELTEKTKWLKNLDRVDGRKLRQVCVELLNDTGDAAKK